MFTRAFYVIVPAVLLWAPTPTAAQTRPAPPAVDAGQSRVIDLRPQLQNKKWREGRTTIYSDKNIELIAEVRRGKVVSVTPINLTGKPIKLRTQQAKPKGRRPCIICYNLDQVLTSTCIEVPCWLVPILKPILNARPA